MKGNVTKLYVNVNENDSHLRKDSSHARKKVTVRKCINEEWLAG